MGENFTEYLDRQSTYRETTIVVINTTPQQEEAILAYMNRYMRSKYNLVGNNCSTAVADALFAAGVGQNSFTDPNAGPLSLPTSLLSAVLAMPGTTVYTVPQGGTIPSALNQFDHQP